MIARSVILTTCARIAYPVLLLFAVALYWRGHNAPGGGFIAGLLTAAAIALRFIAHGRRDRSGASAPFITAIGVGLAIALTTAFGSLAFGHAFFTHTFGHFHLPLIGDVELATAALFDLGVYIVVVGNVITVVSAMTDREPGED